LAFESLPGIKITDYDNKKSFIIADFFSVYENPEEVPLIYKWSDFSCITETLDAFTFKLGKNGKNREFVIPMELIPDPAQRIRARAIIEGAIAANTSIEYIHGRRILPTKTLCMGCEIPPEAYVATGSYREGEINNSNVILQNPSFYKLIWLFAPLAAVLALIAQILYFGDTVSNIFKFVAISILTGGVVGISIYLFCSYAAKTLYKKILKEDPAILEEITFVVCEDGFMASESEVYDFSDIINWYQVDYFVETNHLYIIFNRNSTVFWLPKRLFPKELHQELGDFIAGKLQNIPIV
jgi:hypothetical protein